MANQPAPRVVSEDEAVVAGEIKGSDGVFYKDRDSDTLYHIANNVKAPPDKAAAARTLLLYRAQQAAKAPATTPPTVPPQAQAHPHTPPEYGDYDENGDIHENTDAQPQPAAVTPPAAPQSAPVAPAAPKPQAKAQTVAPQPAKIEKREWPNLSAALAAAQGQIVAAEKNRENPFFKSRYATLESVWDACRAALSANGLAVIQIPVNGEERGQVGVTTILAHASGEQISGTIYAKAMKDDAQGFGSVITYLRRYSLASFVGVTSEEDDDGNAATNQQKQQQRK